MYKNKIIRNWTAALSMVTLPGVFFGACHKTQPDSGTSQQATGNTVQQTIANSFSTSLFNEALHYTGLDDSLKGSGPYTIFVPVDAAFNSMGISSIAQIDTMDKVKLTHLLKYHILYGQGIKRLGVDSKPNNPFVNWDGKTLYLSRPYSGDAVNNYNFTANGDTVLQADIVAANGVVHTLNKVLEYQTYNTCADYLSADTTFSFFVAGLKHFGLYRLLQSAGPVTVLAPINDAFRTVGIDIDSIGRMDTTHISSLLFKVYLMTSLLHFNAPTLSYSLFAYFSPDNTYEILYSGYYDPNYNNPDANTPYPGVTAVAFDPVTHDQLQLYTFNDGNEALPYYGQPYNQARIISQDHPAGNGVIVVIGETLAGPDACKLN